MELIAKLFGLVCVFFAGFFGHLAAHDFCSIAPRLSQRIVTFAVTLLPEGVRDRYREEWLADLSEQGGVIAKLIWSFGCAWCARRIGRRALCSHLAGRTVL